ncbi:MAG: hypothetical protein IKU50_08545 [Bacteroidaceae bacterium]|nr:hypothetical protein [Bacteroidaceae bacterium]
MGFWGWLITIVIVVIVCRLLRAMFRAVDWIVYILLFGSAIYAGIYNESFWAGFLAAVIGAIAARFFFGIGSGTEVYKFGNKYTLTCRECGYHDLEIVAHTDEGVIVRCVRCKDESHHKLNH